VTVRFATLLRGFHVSLLGVDLCAERVSAAVYDIEGRAIGAGEADVRTERPAAGRHEVWMDRVWDAVTAAVRKAVGEASDPVTAMSLAAEADVAVPIDASGAPLAPAVLDDDRRGEPVARDFQESTSPIEVMRLTGMPGGVGRPLVRLLTLRAEDRDAFAKTWKVMDWQSWLMSRLGPTPVTDPSAAGRSQMFDILNVRWADEVLDAAGIDPDILCDVRPAGTPLGEISRHAADELGLPPDVKLVLGGWRRAVAALGAGVAEQGHALNTVEDAEVLLTAFHEPALDVGMMKNGFSCSPHVVPEMFVSLGFHPGGADVLAWCERLLGTPGGTAADAVDAFLNEMPDEPSNLVVLPYLRASGTPYRDPEPLGAVVGLSFDTTRGEVVRGVLEGLALEMKLNAALLAESGVRHTELHLTGAPARSRKWSQLKSDVMGLPVRCHVGVSPAVLGAAMLAGVGTGVYEDVRTAVEFCIADEEGVWPHGEHSDLYDARFARYRRLYPALREIFPVRGGRP
jgi:xylulokinase